MRCRCIPSTETLVHRGAYVAIRKPPNYGDSPYTDRYRHVTPEHKELQRGIKTQNLKGDQIGCKPHYLLSL
jgi:hypothetical protein